MAAFDLTLQYFLYYATLLMISLLFSLAKRNTEDYDQDLEEELNEKVAYQ